MRARSGFAMAIGAVALAAPFFPGRARACELAVPSAHTVDPAQVGVDQTPPQLAQPTVAELQNLEPAGGGCSPKCGWEHSAKLTNLATDDMTPADRIGYRVTLVAGPAPGPTAGRTGAVLARTDGSLTLYWDGDDDFDFTIQLIAIDAAGNESAPRTVQITSGGGGCSVGHRRASDGLALAVLALALAGARARPARWSTASCPASRSRARPSKAAGHAGSARTAQLIREDRGAQGRIDEPQPDARRQIVELDERPTPANLGQRLDRPRRPSS